MISDRVSILRAKGQGGANYVAALFANKTAWGIAGHIKSYVSIKKCEGTIY